MTLTNILNVIVRDDVLALPERECESGIILKHTLVPLYSQLASTNKIHYLKIVYTIRPKKKRHNII